MRGQRGSELRIRRRCAAEEAGGRILVEYRAERDLAGENREPDTDVGGTGLFEKTEVEWVPKRSHCQMAKAVSWCLRAGRGGREKPGRGLAAEGEQNLEVLGRPWERKRAW